MLWGFAGLCLLSGSGWMLLQAWPSEIGWPFASCIHYAVIGCVAFGLAAVRGRWKSLRVLQMVALAGAGLCLLVVPAAALDLAAGKVSEFTGVAAFCAVPLMTVVGAGFWGTDATEASRLRSLVAPSIAGLSGAVVLFPISLPGSFRSWLLLGLVAGACVVVAAASVLMHTLMKGAGVVEALAVIGLACAAILGLWGASIEWPVMGARLFASEILRGAVVDLPEIWLLVWLIREVTPARLSARFLFVPLVTVLEGYAALHAMLEWRQILAAGLLALGGAMLLFREESEEIRGLRLG